MIHINIVATLIIILLFVYAIARQFMARPISRMSFMFLPLLALLEAYESYPKEGITPSELTQCGVMVLLALISASIQALNTDVFYQGDRLFRRSRPVAILTWAVYFSVRLVMRYAFSNTGSWTMWFGMAVIFGIKNAILYFKYPEIGLELSKHSDRHRNRS